MHIILVRIPPGFVKARDKEPIFVPLANPDTQICNHPCVALHNQVDQGAATLGISLENF